MAEKQWQLQEAKNKFSSLVNQAKTQGPQIVTRHGEKVAVVISFEEYRQLSRPRESLVDFFQRSPLSDVDLELTRSKELPREVEL